MSKDILSFREDYRFLSNFYKSLFRIDGKLYMTVEHWYQANKASDEKTFEEIRLCLTASLAKEHGQNIKLRDDWESIKLDVMWRGVHAKFSQNEILKNKLIATGDGLLVEGNTWGDT